MIIIYPKDNKKSQVVSILEYDQKGFVTPSDHCALAFSKKTKTRDYHYAGKNITHKIIQASMLLLIVKNCELTFHCMFLRTVSKEKISMHYPKETLEGKYGTLLVM